MILVTGLRRSGLNMTAKTLIACGVFAKGTADGVESPAITTQILRSQFTRVDVEMFLVRQGYQFGPWMIKEPRLLDIWRDVNREFPKAKWVLVRRNARDIVASCLKTTYMKGTEEEWWERVKEGEERLNEIKANVKNWIEHWQGIDDDSRMVDWALG